MGLRKKIRSFASQMFKLRWKAGFDKRQLIQHSLVHAFPLPCLSTVIKKMDKFRKKNDVVWWKKHKKYHLANWETICSPKDQGGLGILDLRCMNISLLTKWLWKLENGEGMWQTIIKEKYMKKTVEIC